LGQTTSIIPHTKNTSMGSQQMLNSGNLVDHIVEKQ
jgi:hypothetical protein